MKYKVGDIVCVQRLKATGVVVDVYPSNKSYIVIRFFHCETKTEQKYFNPNYETLKVLS